MQKYRQILAYISLTELSQKTIDNSQVITVVLGTPAGEVIRVLSLFGVNYWLYSFVWAKSAFKLVHIN